MRIRVIFLIVVIQACLLPVFFTKAQKQKTIFLADQKDFVTKKGLFDSEDVFQLTLKGNIRDLLNDRTGEAKNFPLVLSYKNDDSSDISLPVDVKTRGNFRRLRENCDLPPLLLQFSIGDAQRSSIFSEQDKLKLVMPCMRDEFVIREWLVYKIYNLFTPYSFRARLVKVKLEDPKSKKNRDAFYGILLEEEKQMAKRNHMILVERKLQPQQVQRDIFLTMAVFEYLIGNTDWSVQYLQNVKLLAADSLSSVLTVPYDFDHAGIVNAPYAKPAEELLMSSVRQRRYRGYCIKDLKTFGGVIEKFNSLKNELYSIYDSCPLLDQKYIKSTKQYLDEFYKTINDTKAWQKDFSYPCDQNGTGNVVIKGLK